MREHTDDRLFPSERRARRPSGPSAASGRSLTWGTASFELMVRSWLCLHARPPLKGPAHRATVRYVAAARPGPRRRSASSPCSTGEEADVSSAGGATPAPPQRAPEGRQPRRITGPPPGW
ncbi:MAG: hypothetical protein ACLRWQ_14065 [Flavonifractor plautii]